MTKPKMPNTWVGGRDNGSEEETVCVVEFVRELPHELHELHHTVHEISVRSGGRVCDKRKRKPSLWSTVAHMRAEQPPVLYFTGDQ